ncbi:MAG: Na+/H+ antiporter subunit E [Shinella sp.]|nr:Na+/H+ antiporter subunit E [Shinella sp.]
MLPHPLLALSLVVMWLLLNGFTFGHLILGGLVAIIASWGMAALRPSKPKIRGWYLLPKFVGVVLYDIVRSNIAVAGVILSGRRRHSGFMTVNLDLKDTTALAILAVVMTSTPGTAWLEYNSADGTVLIHVLDLVDEETWRDLIKNRYERMLMEIFQ